ncbi:MAG: hypothetical protein WDM76_18025 [Limisphaerales bacterium]
MNSTVSAGSVTDNETTEINGDSVTTTFGQTYNGAVILGGAGETRTLSGASVNLAGTVAGGSKNLTVNSPGGKRPSATPSAASMRSRLTPKAARRSTVLFLRVP